MFGIPENVKGAVSLEDLANAAVSGQPAPATQPAQQPVQNSTPAWETQAPAQPVQQPVQNSTPNWGTQAPVQQALVQNSTPDWGTQAPVQQAPVQNSTPTWGTQAPVQPAQPVAPVQPVQPVTPAPQPVTSAPVQPVAPTPRPAGGGVILAKGQKVSLSKMNPNLNEIFVGLGWDIGPNGQGYDLDSEAFILGANGKVLGDDWFVFYNQPASPDGSVTHSGDNKTGDGVGDDEVINIRLSQLNPNADKIVFVVSINEALEKGYNFSNVCNAYVRVVDKSTNKELVKFNLTDYYKEVTSMIVGELYKKGGEWRFNPVGNGVAKDLLGLCEMYGVNVAG